MPRNSLRVLKIAISRVGWVFVRFQIHSREYWQMKIPSLQGGNVNSKLKGAISHLLLPPNASLFSMVHVGKGQQYRSELVGKSSAKDEVLRKKNTHDMVMPHLLTEETILYPLVECMMVTTKPKKKTNKCPGQQLPIVTGDLHAYTATENPPCTGSTMPCGNQ